MLAAWTLLSIRLTVCVQDASSVPPPEWNKARRLATDIFKRAGLELVWLNQKECQPPALCMGFSPHLPAGVHPDTAGYTVFPSEGSRAYAVIYIPGVAETAHGLSVDRAIMLGATVAHEVGHLLLGSRAHSSGVMSARFDSGQMRAAGRGELLFGGEDARRIRRAAVDQRAWTVPCPVVP
jgi:hypothetical protein